jgi:hypothetical protein
MQIGHGILLIIGPRTSGAPEDDRSPARAPVAPSSSPVATFADYKRLLADRPAKFDDAQSQYRMATGKERCGACMHFFESPVSGYTVCEVVRPVPERPIHPAWVCKFFTPDGEDYPLVPEEEKGGRNGSQEGPQEGAQGRSVLKRSRASRDASPKSTTERG